MLSLAVAYRHSKIVYLMLKQFSLCARCKDTHNLTSVEEHFVVTFPTVRERSSWLLRSQPAGRTHEAGPSPAGSKQTHE